MIRRRRQKSTNVHYGLLVNKEAKNYSRSAVSGLIGAIRNAGGQYTITEPSTALELFNDARQMVGLEKPARHIEESIGKRGKITAVIACGGDGTVNLVSRAALEADLPVGALPMGRDNNIARSVLGSADTKVATESILRRRYRPIDHGVAADQPFFGSMSIGFMPELHRVLVDRGRPRFSTGWRKVVAEAFQKTQVRRLTMTVDSYRFEAEPSLLTINLLPYSCSLEVSPASLIDDGEAEVIFDSSPGNETLLTWVKDTAKQKYLYGSDVKLYRGRRISFAPTDGMIMYLDGELIQLPTRTMEVTVQNKSLRVFC